MNMVETDSNAKLIGLIEERPVLWDRTIDQYKDRLKTKEAWYDICTALDEDYENKSDAERKQFWQTVMKKWTNLRDAFMKTMRATGERKRRYVYHDQLQFLAKVVQPPKTIKNFGEEDHDTSGLIRFESSMSEGEYVQETPVSQTRIPSSRIKAKKRKLEETAATEVYQTAGDQLKTDNARMMFLKSVYPSVEPFTNSQFLEFQIGLLQLIKNISSQS